MFASGRTARLARLRLTLRQLLNGDCQNKKNTEHYCNGCCPSKGATVARLQKYFVKLLLSGGIKLFPRSNWLGIDESLDTIGLLASVPDMGRKAFAIAFGYMRASELAVVAEGGDGNGDPAPLGLVGHVDGHAALQDECLAVVAYEGPSVEDAFRKEHMTSLKIALGDFKDGQGAPLEPVPVAAHRE